jgi:isopenicillin-N epimerase
MRRRDFITKGGLLLGASATAVGAAGCQRRPRAKATTATRAAQAQPATQAGPASLEDWSDVRALFDLDPGTRHFAAFLLAAHPRPVREAIERHRHAMDTDPHGYLEQSLEIEDRVGKAAAQYLGASTPDEIALTDSTTMGLGLLYGGLRLAAGQEVVTTTHDFYSTHEALRLRARRIGGAVRKVPLYRKPSSASVDEIVGSVRRAITRRTRVLAVTWVHSSTGVKLPVREISAAVADLNRDRAPGDRVLVCVDGVHGFGIEDATVTDLGCDFLVSGCHKWLFGPRGTGLVWGRRAAWAAATATIPTFSSSPSGPTPPGPAMTPGGFHSFEHRWALTDAFELHQRIGKRRIADRTHTLAAQLKDGLAGMPHVTLHTPRDPRLSAGIVCFEVDGIQPFETVQHLQAEKIAASVTPYATPYARLGPSIVTAPEDVDAALSAIRAIA